MNDNIYAEITTRIIEQLQNGVVPWKSPYLSKVGFPQNFASGKRYTGINVFLLACRRYTSPHFLTYRQAQELGGQVRKGEKGSLVIKYGTYRRADEQSENDETAEDVRQYLKAYSVFNASQIDGIQFPKPENLPQLPAHASCDRARAMVARMPNAPAVFEGTAFPCYRRRTDSVHMPKRGYFTSEESYFSTLFHELAHSTGHESRLARKSLLENKGIDVTGEARKIYAEEELVAEMGAAFLCAHAGIIESEIQNPAAYLQGWIDALNPRTQKAGSFVPHRRRKKLPTTFLNRRARTSLEKS